MSKYAERLNKDTKTINAEAAVVAEAGAKAQVEQAISGYKAQIAKTTAAYNSALGQVDFNINSVLKLTKELNQLNEDLATAEQILKEEFTA